MTTITGQLLMGADQKISIKIPLSPANPELVDVPLEELLEEYVGKQVHIEILPVESRINKGGK
jgi:hypothetical protein